SAIRLEHTQGGKERMTGPVARSYPKNCKMRSCFARRILKLGRWSILWLACLVVKHGIADSSKISPDLIPLLSNPSKTVDVIVQYNSTPQICANGELLCSTGSFLD